MIPRFLIAVPAAALLALLSYWSAVARPVERHDGIAAGLALERGHDVAGAERELLAAADWDHLYEPRWTLAGFYFRHDRVDDFWFWTRKALEVGRHDLGALFDLCWQVTGDPAVVWARAIPDRKEIWNEYLAYLLTAGRWNAAVDVASRLAARSTREDVPVLLGFCDLAIEKSEPGAARPAWNGLCERALIPSSAIGPAQFLVNGDAMQRPLARAFDWRLPPVSGVRIEWTPGAFHVAFAGNQPPGTDVLTQPLALLSNGRYVFRYRYSTRDIGTGLRWQLRTGSVVEAESPNLSSDGERGSVEFSGNPALLALTCERSCAGSIVLREMSILRQ